MSDLSPDEVVSERLQMLLAGRAEIDAEIAALLPPSPTSFHQHRASTSKQSPLSRDAPRTFPPSGATMARHLSSDRIEKSSSQRSSHSMTRTNSKGSGLVRAASTGISPQTSRPLSAFPRTTSVDQPWSTYTYDFPPSMSQRKPDLEQVLEVGEDPAAWLHRTGGAPSLSIAATTPLPIPNSSQHRSPFSPSSQGLPTPTTPTSGSLTNAPTLTTDMSRQSSFCNDHLLHSIDMLNVHSNASFLSTDHSADHASTDHAVALYVPTLNNHRSSNEEQSLLLKGTGGASHDSQFSPSLFTAEDVAQCHASDFSGAKMEKSSSNESTSSSSSSSSSRSKERLMAQIQTAASRPLAPKCDGDELAMSLSKSSQSMTRIGSQDGSQEETVASKPLYQRPKHDRVFCTECDDHPDGFRGDHELRRHKDRQHKTTVKKWVCIQPSGPQHPRPAQSLSKCKACAQQKKKYNAYYNAAAHLRRAHFRPKAKGRSKASKVDDANKRGGKAGGDWPPMSELKHWMMEVEEQVIDYDRASSQQDEADGSDEGEEFDETSSSIVGGALGHNFDSSPYISDLPFNAYSPQTNGDLLSMNGMQFLEHSQPSQQSIDSSIAGSQNSFDSFSLFQNDALAFSDLSPIYLPQPSDDQLLGPEHVQFSFH